MPFKPFSFEYKILALVFLILCLVGVTGVYAYLQFSEVVADVNNKNNPGSKLLLTEALLHNLTKAENNVKSFTLTADTIHLIQFHKNSDRVAENLEKLYNRVEDTSLLSQQLDSLTSLVDDKFFVMSQLLLLQDQFRVQQALDRVALEIEQAAMKIEEQSKNSEAEQPKKKKVFGWLFKKRRKKKQVQQSTVDPNEEVTIAEVNQEVKKVKEEEKNIEDYLKSSELELITEEREITLKIQSLLELIKTTELEKVSIEKEKLEINIKSTNQRIALFCIALGILILVMGFVVISYVKNNRRYRKALGKAKRRAEELAKTKERFLANMSHEIRTPMNAIVGFTEQIGMGNLSSEQQEQLSIVKKSTNHLIHLVNDILDFTKLENNKLQLQKQVFQLIKPVEEVILSTKPLLKDDSIELNFSMSKDVPPVVLGDEFRLRQVLLNLLSNSVKFTKKGKINLVVSVDSKEEQHTIVKFEVIDTGIGMKRNQLNRVFNEFEQAEKSTAKKYGGTGLGLSITKMLVGMHGGDIRIDSTYKQGTSVSVFIPYLPADENKIRKNENKNYDVSILKGLKILIADDEPYNRKLLISILSKYGATYTEAKDGLEAVCKLSENNYDLILMDARMPKLDGIEASKKIRNIEDEEKRYTPIIALSAAILEEDKIGYMEAGMNDFLAKPFKEHELMEVISRVLEVKEQVIEGKKETQPKDREQVAKIDLSKLKQTAGGDHQFVKDMLQTFIDSTIEGVEAMEKAYKKKEWNDLADQAHKIASPCNHLSANNLYDLLKQVESDCRNQENIESVASLMTSIRNEAKIVVDEVKMELKKMT